MASIALSKDDELFIKRQLESGLYETADEVVHAGLQMLEDHQDARERWLREEIAGRLEELRQSSDKAIPLDQVFDELEARHRNRLSKDR